MKRNTLTTAVLAGLTGIAGLVGTAQAVNVNPDGLGQVLIYPYYTARGGNDTLISVVNTTSDAKAVKVRFIEALNSREVLDFNLYLSEYDVWTAAITDLEAAGLGSGPGIVTRDTSCKAPDFGDVQEFLTFQYAGNTRLTQDFGPQGAERTASGYIEIIEMGTLTNEGGTRGFNPEAWVTHGSDRVPADCDSINDAWIDGPWGFGFGSIGGDPRVQTARSTGGLFGGASIVDVAEGIMFTYNATAIDRFYDGLADAAEQHTDPGSLLPSLNSGDDVSRVFVNGVVDETTWTAPIFAVNATMMQEELYNEYNVASSSVDAKTEWVLTFPTKRNHTDNLALVGSAIPPFTSEWASFAPSGALSAIGQACEEFELRVFDREEQEPDSGDIVVSPPPPGRAGFQLCREANVIRFSGDGAAPAESEILGEPLRENTNLSYTNFNLPDGFESGWVLFDLAFVNETVASGVIERKTNIGSSLTRGPVQYVGLPVLGFAVNTFLNNNASEGVRANYGGTFNHRGSRRIDPVSTQ